MTAGGRNQLPALPAHFVQFFLHAVVQLAPEQLVRHFDDFMAPTLAHGLGSFALSSPAFGRRPALRNASRSTYSICALSERSSSSAQRCAAASTAALIRSG